jgi:hypothetical protein
MPNSIPLVQECDATGDDSSKSVGPTKKYLIIILQEVFPLLLSAKMFIDHSNFIEGKLCSQLNGYYHLPSPLRGTLVLKECYWAFAKSQYSNQPSIHIDLPDPFASLRDDKTPEVQ